MQRSITSRVTAFGLMSAACFGACAESPAPSSNQNAVDLAYAALVSDVANCAKQVKSCVDAAGSDDAATSACRDDFATCREAAGKPVIDKLVSAVRSCTSDHNKCVRSADRGEAGSCESELRTCLGAAHAKTDGDEDAGTDESKTARADCLDQLHPCVKADGPANTCAEQVRMCLVDSVPGADAVVPEKDDDEASDEGMSTDAGSEEAAGKPSDAGGSKGKSADHSKADSAQDAGVHGKAKTSAARMCVDSLRECIDTGSAPRDCAKSLKDCRKSATP